MPSASIVKWPASRASSSAARPPSNARSGDQDRASLGSRPSEDDAGRGRPPTVPAESATGLVLETTRLWLIPHHSRGAALAQTHYSRASKARSARWRSSPSTRSRQLALTACSLAATPSCPDRYKPPTRSSWRMAGSLPLTGEFQRPQGCQEVAESVVVFGKGFAHACSDLPAADWTNP